MKHKTFVKTSIYISFNLILSSFICCSCAYAGIVLRIVGVNPNEKLEQTVELKTYLPEEVEPEDILEKDDLEVSYDTQKGAYYVHGEYSLKPNESITREIEIRDIWTIPEDRLEGMRADTLETVSFLEGTKFGERAAFIQKGIEEKLDEIVRRQKVVDANPQKHISNYRRNVGMLESVKTDLILLKSISGQTKPLPSVAIWKVFMFIIIFLGLTSGTLFLFWRKRIRSPIRESASPVEGDQSAEETSAGAVDEEKKE